MRATYSLTIPMPASRERERVGGRGEERGLGSLDSRVLGVHGSTAAVAADPHLGLVVGGAEAVLVAARAGHGPTLAHVLQLGLAHTAPGQLAPCRTDTHQLL